MTIMIKKYLHTTYKHALQWRKKNVFARLQYVRYVQINIVLYSINNYCSLLPIFVEPYFAEENRYCNSNINDFVMDFDICSIVKTSHLGKSALVDANYCWTFHFPCYLWAWFLKFLLLNTTSNSFFFSPALKILELISESSHYWCQFETKSAKFL